MERRKWQIRNNRQESETISVLCFSLLTIHFQFSIFETEDMKQFSVSPSENEKKIRVNDDTEEEILDEAIVRRH